jgi:exosortase
VSLASALAGRTDSRPAAGTAMWHVAAAAALSTLAILATWPVWVQLVRDGMRDEERTNSFLAIPVAAWLVWLRRARLREARPAWSLAGPVLVAAGWALSATGFRMGIELALNIGAVLVVLGAAYACLGRQVFGLFLPAVGALFLMAPLPGRVRLVLAGPLQEWSAAISGSFLDLLGVPALRSGNVLVINGVEVGIAEACNGMRMVAALGVIAYAFAFSTRLRPGVRILLLAVSPIVALGVNVLRLIPTVLLFGYARRATAEGFHDLSGWIALALAIVLMFGLVALLRWLGFPTDAPARTIGSSGHEPCERTSVTAPVAAVVLLAAALILGGFDAARPASAPEYQARVAAAIRALPYRLGRAVGLDRPVRPGALRILRPNAILERQYLDAGSGEGFGLTIVHCSDARDLEDHYPPRCYPANGWTSGPAQELALEAQGIEVPARVYRFVRQSDRGESRARVLSFFVLPGDTISSDMSAVTAASRSTARAGLGAAHIMVSFDGGADDDAIRRLMGPVLEDLLPVVRTIQGGTR